MVPALLNPVIIRLPWIKEDNVIIKPVINTLTINFYRLTILTKKTPVLLEIKELPAAPFAILIKGARKRRKSVTVFKALLKNITKVLKLKIKKILAELRELLPA